MEANAVSESAEVVDVPSSIATNVIGQNTDVPATSSSELMCERSCEELANLFQELKGLRVVVSNLIDGLQKVVSPALTDPDVSAVKSRSDLLPFLKSVFDVQCFHAFGIVLFIFHRIPDLNEIRLYLNV